MQVVELSQEQLKWSRWPVDNGSTAQGNYWLIQLPGVWISNGDKIGIYKRDVGGRFGMQWTRCFGSCEIGGVAWCDNSFCIWRRLAVDMRKLISYVMFWDHEVEKEWGIEIT